MTEDTALRAVAECWMGHADAALASADSELAARRFDFAANRPYYASFHAASALLLAAGRKFAKHSGVRDAVHRDLVMAGALDIACGKAYGRMFEARRAADYLKLFELEPAHVEEMVDLPRGFVGEMQRLFAAGFE